MLLDIGDLDEAIRQLNAAVQHEPENSLTNALLSQAFTRKEAYGEGEKFGREAVRINPGHAEAHFMLAEALRGGKKCDESKKEYETYLRLSDFDSKLAGKLNYYMLGYLVGMGKKKRAAQTDIWRELQFMANFGLCDCDRMSQQFDSAIHHCQVALTQDPKDPIAHYDLAIAYSQKFNQTKSAGLLAAAKTHFETVVQLNPDMAEAEKAKKYIANIDQVFSKLNSPQ
jgi:tetratricopeptide (TPR) repeat protein